MVGSLPWDSQAAWDNKVLLATKFSYRSQLLVMCVYTLQSQQTPYTSLAIAAHLQACMDLMLRAVCKVSLPLQMR